ncbi:MAG TPA: ATP-binding cassette domain-containing protein [Ktedonobacteraceae bacterium]
MTHTATLHIAHVSKQYGSGTALVSAVRDVSLEVAPGEIVLIMGPSGSGKTTLLQMMGALLKPTEGTIQLNGTMLSALAEHRLPGIRLHQFGFIFQDFNLLSALTVLDNVALVAELASTKRREARKRAATLLTELGLGERLHFLPEQLSGGEKQRVSIARALVNDPALILADEPTANLDSKIGHEMMRLLQTIAKEQGRSVVIVSHDQRIQDIADRVLWLEDGQFKEMATMATDPVCGMKLEREKAVTTAWEGQSYYFCSRGCRNEFLEEPQHFLREIPLRKSHSAGPNRRLALFGLLLALLSRQAQKPEAHPELLATLSSLVDGRYPQTWSEAQRGRVVAQDIIEPLAIQLLLSSIYHGGASETPGESSPGSGELLATSSLRA